MPKGPKGEKRPADTVQAAIMVAKIATGEVDPGKEYARKGGLKGGTSRAKKLSPERRKEIASRAAAKRWGKT